MYALVDCNSFYASCEKVFRPELRDAPVVVLSNNDGCVVARSPEAKACGIPMAAPIFKMKDLVRRHNVRVFSSNYVLYGDMSSRFMNILRRFSPEVEVYSIDEAFMDLGGLEPLKTQGRRIRATVLQELGLPTCVGVGPTKTLAKLANHIAKRYPELGGVCVVDTEKKRVRALELTPAAEVWGIGRRHASRLKNYSVRTALDFSRMPPGWVRRHMSVVGERTQRELLGKPALSLELVRSRKKSICVSRSFGKELTDFSQLREALSAFVLNCSSKLRSEKACATVLQVFVMTNRFKEARPQYSNSLSMSLQTPSSSGLELNRLASQMLEGLYREGFGYKKIGVVMHGLIPENEVMGNLFDPVDRSRHAALMKKLDELNRRYGSGTVRFASQGFGKGWHHRQERLSPCCSTRWEELMEVASS
ncbi:MAG: Y-family DNA polymerase [Cytophagales bacterium]|nr:Y-family DNA polymerase [Cytophagales bacterium]